MNNFCPPRTRDGRVGSTNSFSVLCRPPSVKFFIFLTWPKLLKKFIQAKKIRFYNSYSYPELHRMGSNYKPLASRACISFWFAEVRLRVTKSPIGIKLRIFETLFQRSTTWARSQLCSFQVVGRAWGQKYWWIAIVSNVSTFLNQT